MSAMANLQTARIEVGDAGAELPLLRPTIGPAMVDLRRLYQDTGCYAYDPALHEIGVCRSTITYVDGDNGVLLYRGYPIDALVENCSSSRSVGSCSMANCRQRRNSNVSRTTSPITRW